MNKTFSGIKKIKALEAAGCGERSDLEDANQRAGGQTRKKQKPQNKEWNKRWYFHANIQTLTDKKKIQIMMEVLKRFINGALFSVFATVLATPAGIPTPTITA